MASAAFEKAWASHTSRAFTLMEEICAVGPRFMGTDGEKKVRPLILRRMRDQGGRDVRAEAIEYLGYRCDEAALDVTTPRPIPVPCEGIVLSAFTPHPGGFEAPLAYAGAGMADDYARLAREGVSVVGRIVLVDAFKSYQTVPVAEEHGALGFILGTTNVKEEVVRIGVTNLSGSPGRIPAVAVTPSRSELLRSLIGRGPTRARLRLRGEYAAATSEVLIAEAPGTHHPDAPLFLVSHFDSHALGPHAADNASGTGALLDLVSFFSRAQPRRTIRFLALPAEELGFIGAKKYVANHLDEVRRARAVVNLDGLICGKAGGTTVDVTEGHRAAVERVIAEHGIEVAEWRCPPRPYSDHAEFQKAGVPVVWLSELDDYYHTGLDLTANIDQARFARHLKAVAAITWDLAMA
jgi:hypothetical protein